MGSHEGPSRFARGFEREQVLNSLTCDALRWMDALWDPATCLLRYERSHPLPRDGVRRHMVRESAWYALGLCMRNDDGDAARVNEILGAVLAQQYRAPGAIWHGTWAQAPEDKQPIRGAVIWRDYDPNWRQFIGATLLIMLRAFPDLLSAQIKAGIVTALRDAVEGEPADRVDARYTNIAMLRAWLEVEAGELLQEPAWTARGESLAAAVVDRYGRFGALDEFNSPTYYGVDLLAAALWARQSKRLAMLGNRIEAMLWQDIADFYHAGMGNLCGPYARAYGMDLRSYIGLVSLWLRQIETSAPLPVIDENLAHGHDLCMAPFIEWLGVCVPMIARPALAQFSGARHHVRRLPGGAIASAWLSDDLMLGAMSGSRAQARDQFHPATAHWPAQHQGEQRGVVGNLSGGTRQISQHLSQQSSQQSSRHLLHPLSQQWLRMRSDGPLHATALPGELRFTVLATQRVTMEASTGDVFVANDVEAMRLPGMHISIERTDDDEANQAHYRMQFAPRSEP